MQYLSHKNVKLKKNHLQNNDHVVSTSKSSWLDINAFGILR